MIDKDRATASFLPTVSLIPSYSFAQSDSDRRNSQSGSDIGDPGNPDDNLGGGSTGSRRTSTGTNNFDLPVNLRMNLFNGFRDVANVRRAGSEIEHAVATARPPGDRPARRRAGRITRCCGRSSRFACWRTR